MTDLTTTNLSQAGEVGFGLDKAWIITSAGFVFLMQIGLGLMEIGSTRRKNARIVWYKIWLNIILTIFFWWVIGFAWAFGDPNGSFIGAERFYAGNKWGEGYSQAINGPDFTPTGPGYNSQYAHFLWRVAIASLSTSIAISILSERITLKGVFVFNLIYNIITLPFIFAWTFGLGFLVQNIGYYDYAGSWIIFGNAAIAGLTGLLLIKPRYNRYGSFPVVLSAVPTNVVVNADRPFISGPEYNRNLPSVAFDKMRPGPITTSAAAHPVSLSAFTFENIIAARKTQEEGRYEYYFVTDYGLVLLGALIFFIGFIFFNGGASQGLQTIYMFTFAEVAAVGTILAAMGGGLGTLIFLTLFARRRPIRDNAVTVARALVAGMVCVAAGANVYRPWAAFVSGLCGAWAYLIWAYIFHRSYLDEPTEFFPIFFGGGLAGILVVAFLNIVDGILYQNATEGEILIWQILSWAIMAGWTFFISFLTFGFLYLTRMLRVGLRTEIVGYDYIDGARHLDYPEKDILSLQKDKRKAQAADGVVEA